MIQYYYKREDEVGLLIIITIINYLLLTKYITNINGH